MRRDGLGLRGQGQAHHGSEKVMVMVMTDSIAVFYWLASVAFGLPSSSATPNPWAADSIKAQPYNDTYPLVVASPRASSDWPGDGSLSRSRFWINLPLPTHVVPPFLSRPGGDEQRGRSLVMACRAPGGVLAATRNTGRSITARCVRSEHAA